MSHRFIVAMQHVDCKRETVPLRTVSVSACTTDVLRCKFLCAEAVLTVHSSMLKARKAVGQALGRDMFAAAHSLPVGAQFGGKGIAFIVAADFGHFDGVGQWQCLGIDLCTTDDPDILR